MCIANIKGVPQFLNHAISTDFNVEKLLLKFINCLDINKMDILMTNNRQF